MMDKSMIPRAVAELATLKQILNRSGSRLTYKEAAAAIGIGNGEWSQEDYRRLITTAEALYAVENLVKTYASSDWACITWESGTTWHWGGHPLGKHLKFNRVRGRR
jgi:hypothetical protein